MNDVNLEDEPLIDADDHIRPLLETDPRPAQEDTEALSGWLLRRSYVSDWDNQFVARLEVVLKRDKDYNLLPEGKAFRNERRGVCVTAISQDGKTTMVWQVLKRLFNDSFDEKKCGEKIAYCRLRHAASVKSVCEDLCRSTGYTKFPAKMTRPEAGDLAAHRLRMAGITIVVIDEVHNLNDPKDVINTFLKTLVQDGGGFCVILIGTPKVRKFIYDDPEHMELAERYLDLPLKPFARAASIELITRALKEVSHDAGVRLAPSIKKDPYFADRIYDGVHGSFGRCMFLIVNSVIRAIEQGGDAVDIEDFREFFDMKYLHFNPENPFEHSDWSSRALAATTVGPDASNVFFEGVAAAAPPKKRGRPRKSAGKTK